MPETIELLQPRANNRCELQGQCASARQANSYEDWYKALRCGLSRRGFILVDTRSNGLPIGWVRKVVIDTKKSLHVPILPSQIQKINPTM